MKAIYYLAIAVLCIGMVSALTGPISYNGKQYYVVTSTNPSEDTGDEVCTMAGMSCVGYTENTDAVCKLQHPNAASTSSMSGDVAGVYCNGAPQVAVCAGLTNSCQTCPACTNTVTCSQAIGGLYREMYVQCAPGNCKVNIQASTVQDLINQISSINSQLAGCPATIPSPANKLVKNGNTFVNINMNNGQTQSFTVTVSNKKVTGVAKGTSGNCVQQVTVSESDVNTALNSQNLGQAVAYLVGQKKAKISGCSFFSKAKLFFLKPFVTLAAKKSAPTPPPPKPAPNCGNMGEQCNNRGCFSGMCGAPKENLNGQWGYWNYQCIDQAMYTANCIGRGNTPAAWQCSARPCP